LNKAGQRQMTAIPMTWKGWPSRVTRSPRHHRASLPPAGRDPPL